MLKIINKVYNIIKYIIRYKNSNNIIIIAFNDKDVNTGYYIDKAIPKEIIIETCIDISNIVKFDLVLTEQQQMQEYKAMQGIKSN